MLIAVYAPLVVVAAWAVVLYGKSVLLPALLKRKLSFREHGIVLAMCGSLSSDVIEQIYWATARLVPSSWNNLSWATGAVFSMKLVALFGAMCAIAAWHQAVEGRLIIKRISAIVISVYLVALTILFTLYR